MKHNDSISLSKESGYTLSLIKKNKNVLVGVEAPSLIPFFLSLFDFKKAFVSSGLFFDEIAGSFGVFPKDVVVFPFIKSFERGSHVVKSFSQEVFEKSSVFFSCSPDKVKTCLIDKRALDEPALYNKKTKSMLVGLGGCSKEDLLSFLQKNNYNLVDSVSSPGEYVLRGGVVDVFSYGLSFPFRLGFFGDSGNVLFFNASTGNIIKKESSSLVYPFPQSCKKTIRQCLDDFFVISYDKGFLKIKNPRSVENNFVLSKDRFSVLEKTNYNKGFSGDGFFFSNKLLSEGCFFNKKKCLPGWLKAVENHKENENLPLSGTLRPGDYYVYDVFGICKYKGFCLGDNKNEKIRLEFLDGKIDLDVKLLNMISFYAPSSNKDIKLGSLSKQGLWKKRRKKSYEDAMAFVESVAENYAKRDIESSSSVMVDESFLLEFISKFPFSDTRDQSLAWKNILGDLVSTKPMFRLLCGDVAFGKTELAIRAAFVVASNNKKTLVLCPTTILCEQLFSSFKERLSPFGVAVGQVSRLTTKNNSTLSLFVDGGCDVIVGTHSVLKNHSVLAEASLIVVDEEHRFGVKDKEKILKHSPGCNYLNMSATPIPRTMQFSLSGIRSISTLASPPRQRRPIITNIYYFKKELVYKAISEEIGRGGQVYVVDNSVENVNYLTSFISKGFPGILVKPLFASLPKNKIIKRMSNFRSGKITVLVSTVIIESGIDIPGANTIIINNANMLGLSQLHQLRGRVGRSSRQSYAYLLISKKGSLTSNGTRRLRSIKKHSSLGSGYSLALEDLEIRGAGSLFGYKQSGKNAVGFEHYSKLLSLAMKKKSFAFFSDTEVDLGDAYISPSFVYSDEERAFYYKNISSTNNAEELFLLLKKTRALFGALPPAFLALFWTKKISLLCEPTPFFKVLKRKSSFDLFVSQSGVLDASSFLFTVDVFFKNKNIKYKIVSESLFLKIQFEYIKEDYYILLESLIKKVNV